MNKNKFIRNGIIFAITFVVFFLMDWLTKYYLFNEASANDAFINKTPSKILYQNDVFGTRSLWHGNTTMFSFLDIDISLTIRSLITYSLVVALSLWVLFASNKTMAIALSIIVAGSMGNGLDNTFHEGRVRDIIFTPWHDGGTFNIADLIVVGGSALLLVSIMMEMFKSKKPTPTN